MDARACGSPEEVLGRADALLYTELRVCRHVGRERDRAALAAFHVGQQDCIIQWLQLGFPNELLHCTSFFSPLFLNPGVAGGRRRLGRGRRRRGGRSKVLTVQDPEYAAANASRSRVQR